MTNLSKRVALVTGASRGIGQATAIALARHGAHVAVNYRVDEQGALETVRRIDALGGCAVAIQADVSRDADVTAMIGQVVDCLGPVDILVNNAGKAVRQDIDNITEQDWDDLMAVNLKSVFLVTRAVLPQLKDQHWGRIVNISSGAAKTGGSVGIHYAASKGGMDALSRAYAANLVGDGITVNIVAPSQIDTGMIPDSEREVRARRIPVGRLGSVEECADSIVLCVNTGYMTGQTIVLNGGRYFS